MTITDSGSSDHVTPETTDILPRDPSAKKGFSCVLCAQRKVRCDRLPGGCGNCTKARAACVYKAPPPPRRRKKGVRDVDLATRLRICEAELRRLDIDPEQLVQRELKRPEVERETTHSIPSLEPYGASQVQKTDTSSDIGVLVANDYRSRYLENGIWTSLKDEFRDSKEILEDSSSEEDDLVADTPSPESSSSNGAAFIFGSPSQSIKLRSLHPSPVQIFKLWQVYLENINPLVKVFHAHRVQQIITEASGNLDKIPKEVEALMFAIYCISVASLSDGDCIATFGEHKSDLVHRFRSGAQQSLINANVLRSSHIMVLKAFTLYILSLQNYDARVVWILSGIALRIAQHIGLHRDPETLNLPPFQIEMRRRLWWQVMLLDGFAQKLAGTGATGTALTAGVKMPSNANDSDLFPAMKELPKEHEGATEMMFFLIRCHVGEFLKKSTSNHAEFDGVWHQLSDSAIQVSAKDKAIDKLQVVFQHKFLQYCDPYIPWHKMCTYLAQCIISMMRFMVHSAAYARAEMPEADKNRLFDLALQVCTSQNLAYTMKEMQGFMWHVSLHFQWKAFIYLISELRHRTRGEKVQKAWQEVEKAYDYHPSFDQEMSRRALPIAVGNLTLKAWDAYISTCGIPPLGEPHFIQLLKTSRAPRHASTSLDAAREIELANSSQQDIFSPLNATEQAIAPFVWDTPDFHHALNIGTFDVDLSALDRPEDMDWSTWSTLEANFQAYDSVGSSADFPAFGLGSGEFFDFTSPR